MLMLDLNQVSLWNPAGTQLHIFTLSVNGMPAMRPIPFGQARRLVEVLHDPPPAAAVIGTEVDFTFLCRHWGARVGNQCQVVVVGVLEGHWADHHKLPYAVIGVGPLRPVGPAAGYAIAAVCELLAELPDTKN